MAKNNHQVVFASIDRCDAEPFNCKYGVEYYKIYVVGKTSDGEYQKKYICSVAPNELLDRWYVIRTVIATLYNLESTEDIKLYFS